MTVKNCPSAFGDKNECADADERGEQRKKAGMCYQKRYKDQCAGSAPKNNFKRAQCAQRA